MEVNDSLTKYEASVNSASTGTSKLNTVLQNVETMSQVVNNMPTIVQNLKEIRMAQLTSRHQLEVLKTQSTHNLYKFDKLIQGAEKRLDFQLKEMSELRQSMRKFSFGQLSQNELAIYTKLNEQLDKIHEGIMYELRMLYSL